VGIVGNVRETGLSAGEVPVMYVPQSQMAEGLTSLANSVLPLAWAVRTKGDPGGLRSAIEREFRAIDSALPITRVRTMEQVVSSTVARQNFNMLLLAIFAGVALLLAAIGVYGLMAYSVEQRTQEIGIRMALGADRADMLRMVLLQGLKLAAVGVALGLGIAYYATRLMAGLLFGVKATDTLTFGVVAGILLAVALASTLIPARQAATIPPSEALRNS
jgi:ABC-type antimicrobial peptide transport system permease subunit